MIFWKKQKEIESAIGEYLDKVRECKSAFLEVIGKYFSEGLSDDFEELVEKTHRLEGEADAKRREIEDAMYGRALIPESRGDVLGMLEAIDLVPNKMESVSYQIWLQNMSVPAEYAERIQLLVKVNAEALDQLCDATSATLENPQDVLAAVEEVRKRERQSDQLERGLIKAIFRASHDKVDKLLLKELVLEIGSISDRAENAADRLRIIAVKRPE